MRERPNIKDVDFEGNDEIENDKLDEAIEIKPNTILSVPAVRRSVQKIKDAYAEKGFFLADVTDEVVDRSATTRSSSSSKSSSTSRSPSAASPSSATTTCSDAELRDDDANGQRRLLRLRLRRRVPAGRVRARRPVISALYYDKGYLSVQIGTPRVMLTPDREGIEITISSTRARASRSGSSDLRARRRRARGRAARRPAALRELVRAQSGDWFNRAELVKDLDAVRTLYRDAGYANVEAEPETELDPRTRRSTSSSRSSAGPLVDFGRIEIKGNTKTRDKVIRREMEIQEGQLFSETASRRSKRRVTALGYFERVDVSTEQGAAPGPAQHQHRGGREADRHLPGRRGLPQHRELHRDRAGPAGEPLRQRPVARAPGAALGAASARDLRFFEPYFLDSDWSTPASSSTITLYVFPNFARRSRRRLAHLRLRAHPALAAPVASRHTLEDDRSTLVDVDVLRHLDAAVLERLPAAAARQPLQRRASRSRSGRRITYDTRDNRLFPTSGIFLQVSTELAPEAFGSEFQFRAPPVHRPLLLPARRRHGQPGSVRAQAQHRGRPHHEPRPAGRADLPALLPRRHPRRARLPAAQHRPAPAAQRRPSTRTRRRSPTAQTSAATSRTTRTSSSSSPSSTRSASAASSSSTPATPGTRGPVLPDDARRPSSQGRSTLLHLAGEHRLPAHVVRASASAGSRRSARCASSGASRCSRCPYEKP